MQQRTDFLSLKPARQVLRDVLPKVARDERWKKTLEIQLQHEATIAMSCGVSQDA
jgi:hypothetical protein